MQSLAVNEVDIVIGLCVSGQGVNINQIIMKKLSQLSHQILSLIISGTIHQTLFLLLLPAGLLVGSTCF